MVSTLIISTYNWPEALELVLLSLIAQTQKPTETIIADDGSTEATKILINDFNAKYNLNIKHVWHKDEGFKKATILNKTIAQAKGDYIIQVDGDCIMHKNFIADHSKAAEKGVYLYGSRVNIQKRFLPVLFDKKNTVFTFYSKGIKNRTRTIHLPFLGALYKKQASFSRKYRGCNTSFFKSDFINVNGYNEEFKGWGREDSELALRFHNYGLSSKRMRYRGIVYHIYHKEKPRNRLEINNDIQKCTISEKVIWCDNGIDKYI